MSIRLFDLLKFDFFFNKYLIFVTRSEIPSNKITMIDPKVAFRLPLSDREEKGQIVHKTELNWLSKDKYESIYKT